MSRVLQRVALCCSVLHELEIGVGDEVVVTFCHERRDSIKSMPTCTCVATCSSVLQRVAMCCSVLQCVAVCCSVLQEPTSRIGDDVVATHCHAS